VCSVCMLLSPAWDAAVTSALTASRNGDGSGVGVRESSGRSVSSSGSGVGALAALPLLLTALPLAAAVARPRLRGEGDVIAAGVGHSSCVSLPRHSVERMRAGVDHSRPSAPPSTIASVVTTLTCLRQCFEVVSLH
jgi:hypothetical protein